MKQYLIGILTGISFAYVIINSSSLFSKHIEYSDYNRLAMEVHDCFYRARSTAPLMWTDDFQPVGAINCEAGEDGYCKDRYHPYDYVKLVPNPQEATMLGPNGKTGEGNAMDICNKIPESK